MQAARNAPFVFGIYPFGVAGTAQGLASGRPDDMAQIGRAIKDLSGGKPFVPRTYVSYVGPRTSESTLSQVAQYCRVGVKWDLVLRFQDSGNDLKPWLALIEAIVKQFGNNLEALQITNEPNLVGMPGSADGNQPSVRQALVEGVLAARAAMRSHPSPLEIGFNVVPNLDPKNDFWQSLPKISKHLTGSSSTFAESINYVGYDIYPDVFGRPVAVSELRFAVEFLLKHLRDSDLKAAGIAATVPIRIAENGWPSGGGQGRSEEKQAVVLEAVIRAVYAGRLQYNVTQYELFGLRDADSSKDDLFHRFGILRDDYSRKPAFETYRKLIAELSSP